MTWKIVAHRINAPWHRRNATGISIQKDGC